MIRRFNLELRALVEQCDGDVYRVSLLELDMPSAIVTHWVQGLRLLRSCVVSECQKGEPAFCVPFAGRLVGRLLSGRTQPATPSLAGNSHDRTAHSPPTRTVRSHPENRVRIAEMGVHSRGQTSGQQLPLGGKVILRML